MTTLIKNIILADGSGRSLQKADVLIRDEKIASVGNFSSYKADKIIFGNELYLCPGFIDLNSSSDRYLTLFSSPLCKDFLIQGVTSMLIGHCGFSLAPSFYGSLNHFWSWSKTNHINLNWKKVGEFLAVLEKQKKIGVNLATLVGHRVIREDIVKDPHEFRNLTANELRVFRFVLTQALKEGAFGMSTGLGYFPYQDTGYHELRALVDVVKQFGRIYTTHLKNEKHFILDAVKETIRLSQEMGMTTIISHLRPFLGFEKDFESSLKLIEEKTAQADVYFDVNPFDASAVPIDSFIPDSLKNSDRNLIIEKLKDEKVAKEAKKAFPRLKADETIILNAPGIESLNGKTLLEFAQNRDLKEGAALLALMEATRLRAVIFYKNLNPQEIEKSLLSSRSLISSNSPNFDDLPLPFKPERAYKSFPVFLKKASSLGMNIEKAVHKISGLPAKILNLEGRGFVSDNYFADLVLLDKDFDVKMTMVNGKIAVEEGNINPAFASGGRVLRHRKK